MSISGIVYYGQAPPSIAIACQYMIFYTQPCHPATSKITSLLVRYDDDILKFQNCAFFAKHLNGKTDGIVYG